jgi:hypothetical protein
LFKTRRQFIAIYFQFLLEYAIRKVRANHEGLKLNGARQMLVYGDDIKMVGGSGGQYIVKKGTDTLLVASKETGLEVKAEKT